ncbi:MAG: SusE domain-containing protein [Bacteroidota bacterium]
MKNNFLKILVPALVLVGAMASCKKQENKIYLEGGTAPVLTSSSAATRVLVMADSIKPGVKFTWTNPNYSFTTGGSSQDVTYVLEVDTTGGNFKSPKKQEISIARNLEVNYNVKELNAILSKMDLLEDMTHDIEFRIKASLANGSVPLYSNVIKVKITPYLDVVVPIPTNGTLWVTGNAFSTPDWSNPLPSPQDVSQKFTKISNTLYELTVGMRGGGNYKLIQVQGEWGSQYHMLTGGTWEGGEFEKKDADPGFIGAPTAGNYKITVNFKTGKFSVVKI